MVYYDYDCIVSCISYYVIIISSVSVCDFDLLRMCCFSCASCLVCQGDPLWTVKPYLSKSAKSRQTFMHGVIQ